MRPLQFYRGLGSSLSTSDQAVLSHILLSPFAMGPVARRIFLCMLSRIDSSKNLIPEWEIPLSEISNHDAALSAEDLYKAQQEVVGYLIDIGSQHKESYRISKPRTIIYKCDYEKKKKALICGFHEHMQTYLLKLFDDFLLVDSHALKQFTDEKSLRFYFLLKSKFITGPVVEVTVEECRQCLLPQGSSAYPFPSDLKKHLLQKVIYTDLARTAYAFDIVSIIRDGKHTEGWEIIHLPGGN